MESLPPALPHLQHEAVTVFWTERPIEIASVKSKQQQKLACFHLCSCVKWCLQLLYFM